MENNSEAYSKVHFAVMVIEASANGNPKSVIRLLRANEAVYLSLF